MTRINIFTGHYGSGKSENALNFALRLRQQNKKVVICDIDIVNPYFRTNDVRKFLTENGIDVISSEFASTNVDMPTLPGDLQSVFSIKDRYVVIDVGGDDDGAIVLGTISSQISKEDYNMFLVVNTLRPDTSSAQDIVSMAKNIESASRLKITSLINNTNLAHLTKAEHITNSTEILSEACDVLGLDTRFTSVKKDLLDQLPENLKSKAIGLDLFLNLPFN